MNNLDEKEYNNIYAIPANYTDSGKILGGMLEPRNAVEAVILLVALGYPELMLIPMSGTMRIVVMTVTLLPLGVLAMMGIDGDSLFQYFGHMLHFTFGRRKPPINHNLIHGILCVFHIIFKFSLYPSFQWRSAPC